MSTFDHPMMAAWPGSSIISVPINPLCGLVVDIANSLLYVYFNILDKQTSEAVINHLLSLRIGSVLKQMLSIYCSVSCCGISFTMGEVVYL